MFWKKKKPKLSQRDILLQQAKDNADKARNAIGEKNLAKLNQVMAAKQKSKEPSPMEEAEKILIQMDKDELGQKLLALIREKSS